MPRWQVFKARSHIDRGVYPKDIGATYALDYSEGSNT
jgi:hypothetical protein